MSTLITLACLFLATLGWTENPPAKTPVKGPHLPEAIRTILNQEYPGWKLAPVSSQVQETFRKHKIGHAPSMLGGDFNADGRKDYVVQITLTQPGEEEQIVIVFLQKDNSYQEIILQSQGLDPTLYLWTGKKQIPETGADGQDKHVLKEVLVVMGGPLGSTTYAFSNGEFHEVKAATTESAPDPGASETAPVTP